MDEHITYTGAFRSSPGCGVRAAVGQLGASSVAGRVYTGTATCKTA